LAHSREFADAVVILPPFYFAPVSSEGLDRFLFAVLGEATIASYLYNFPKYTQLAISPELLRLLAERVRSLKGIKDSDPDLRSSVSFKKANPRLQVLSGNDDSLVEVYSAGLDGVVAGGCNAFPELLCSVSRRVAADTKKAVALQRLFEKWKQFRIQASLGSIAAVKLGISSRIPSYPYEVRPPLVTASQHLQTEVAELVKAMLDDHCSILNS
jgi:4-hydroxy-tetrahydrodipicolinate synthase